MTPAQYKKAIEAVGLNINSAAKFLGVLPRQSRRYASGEAKVPEATAMLLRHMVVDGLKPEDVK